MHLHNNMYCTVTPQAGSLKMNTALEYSTRVVQEGGRRCKKSTLNDLVHLTPLRIPLMNPPHLSLIQLVLCNDDILTLLSVTYFIENFTDLC
jgi:hypothetical protein